MTIVAIQIMLGEGNVYEKYLIYSFILYFLYELVMSVVTYCRWQMRKQHYRVMLYRFIRSFSDY